jgi:plasmid stability protein
VHSENAANAAKIITIRDVPNETRDELAARAARAGQSLQEYLSRTLREIAEKPDVNTALAEIRARARNFPPVTTQEILDAIAADRR